MPEKQPQSQAVNIVLRGDFNPKIFQPFWFGAQNLIRQEEVSDANIKIIHSDICAFSISWMELEVTRDKFAILSTQEAYYEVIRDIVLGTFSILEHTPLRNLGINLVMHFKIDSEVQWHKLGDTLAPKDIWRKLLNSPGMRSLTIEESKRPDGYKGYTTITVEPSLRVQPGVYFQINDHYEVKNRESIVGSYEVVEILSERWSSSISRSRDLIKGTLEGI